MGDIKQLLIPIVVAGWIATTGFGREQNSDPTRDRQSPVGQDVRMWDRSTKTIVGNDMKYKTVKKSILADICEMIKQAQDSGWPFREGDFAEQSDVNESKEIQKIIEETYWEICIKKGALNE